MSYELLPLSVKRKDLQALLDAAFNHVVTCKMIGMHSSSGDTLEKAAMQIPCPYCGEVGLVHNTSCDRVFWRGTPDYERLLKEFRREAE
jgi:hypothetical protein